MSHYTVLAIIRKGSRQTLESILAPYDENKQVEPYVYKTKAQLIAQEIQAIEKHRRSHAAAVSLTRDEYYAIADEEDLYGGYERMKEDLPYGLDSIDLTDEAAIFRHIKKIYGDDINEDGDLISTYNPDSKWDWYDVGGRWGGSLALKAGGRADEAKAAEIDWDAMFKLDPEEEKRCSEFWDEYVLGKLPEDIASKGEKEINDYLCEKHGFLMYRKEYYLERYGTKAEYLRRHAIWATYAVVDDRGWYAPGEMGWFGCSDETAETQRDWDENFRSRYIDTLDPEDTVIVVDCHI